MHHQGTARRRTVFLGRRPWLKLGAATVVGAVIAAGAIVPAQAATGDISASEGLLLSGGGIVNVDTLAQLRGAYSSTNATSSAGAVSNPLDLTALSTVGVGLGNGVQLLGTNGILNLGVVGQYASSTATSATASAGLVGSDGSIAVGSGTPGSASSLNLTPLLSRIGASATVASAAQLDVGALASTITATRGTTVGTTTGYGIASAGFTVTSPAIGTLNTSLQTAVNGIGSDLNGLTTNQAALNGVVSGSTGSITTALNSLGLGALSLNGTTATTNLTGLSLSAVTAPVLARQYTSGAVTITPSTGKIVIDLNTLQALNGQDPNTQLLSTPALRSLVTAAIQDILVTQLPAALNTAVVTAVGNATLTTTITGRIQLAGVNVSNLTITTSTTLANLLKTSGRAPATVSASATAIGVTGLSISSAVLTPVLQPVVDNTVVPLLAAVFQPTVGGVTATLAAVTGPVNTTVSALTGILSQLVSITVNAQDSSGFRDARGTDQGSRSVHALRLSILPALDAAVVDLATSTVNATPTAPLTIATPTQGQQFTVATSTATRSVTVTGTGEPGATIAVDLGAGRTGTATVAPDGSWSATIPGVGVGSVTASVTQSIGGTASPAVTRDFTVVAQQPLTIQAPTEGRVFTVVSGTATTPVTVQGTATPGASVSVDLGSGRTATATTAADGTWSAPFTGVPVGSYTASAVQTVGGTTSSAVTRDFSVAAGAALTVTAPADGTQLVVPGATSTTTVTVTGTAQPGASVTADLGGGLTATSTAGADGGYSIPVTAVGVGSYTVSVTQTVAGTQSAPITRGIQVVAASPITIQTPVAGAQFRVAGPTSTSPVTVSGTAQAGSAVQVQIASGVSATVTASVTGTWTTTFPSVAVGDYTISATQTVAGATSAPVTRDISVVAGAPVVIQVPAAGARTTVADPTSTTPVTVSGTAEPSAPVTVSLGGGRSATVTASGTGAWTTTFPAVPVGDYTVSASQTVGGTTSTPVTRPFSVMAAAPVVITAPDPAVDVVVAGPGTTADITVAGTAQPNADIAVDLGGGLTATTTAGTDGTWSVPVNDVPIGTRTISVTQTVGGTTSPAVTQDLTVRAGAPLAIVRPAPDASVTVFGTDTATVAVSGTAQPGAVVTASFGGGLAATTTASGSGAWSVTIPGVAVGDYTLTATQSINGSTSAPESQPFHVVTGGAIVIQAPVDGSTFLVADASGTRTTEVAGRADAGADVTVDLGAGLVRTTTAGPTGAWTVSFADLPVATYTVNATQAVGGATDDATPTTFAIRAADPVTVVAPAADAVVLVAGPTSVVPVPISGSAQPGATVTVDLGTAGTVTTTAGADGSWQVTADGSSDGSGDGLGVGSYTASVTQTLGGTTSAPVTRDFSVAAGSLFTVATPIDGTVVRVADASSTLAVVVSGQGQIGATVDVTLGTTTRTTTVALNGSWSTTFPAVGTGTRLFSSTETVGGTTTAPVERTLVIQAATPVAITAPATGSKVTVAGPSSTTTVSVTGTAEPNASVSIDLGAGVTATTTSSPTGVWSIDVPDLGVGAYAIRATQTVNGTTSAPVDTMFSIVAGAPVTVTSPADGGRVVVADASSTVDLPVSGTAEPGAVVTVDLGDALTATTTAGADGSWSTTVADVPVGTRTISATEQVGGTTSDPVTSAVRVVAGSPLIVVSPAQGTSIVVADTSSTLELPVSGTAQAGASVSVTLDGGTARVATADSSGSWSTTFPGTGVGSHVVRATQTVGGTTSPVVTRGVDIVAAATLTVTQPSTGAVFVVASPTSTTSILVQGAAQPGSTVTAEAPGGIAGTATTRADGTYSLTLDDVPTGPRTISVTQTVGGTTTATPVTVDVTVQAAAAVVISAPTAGQPLFVSGPTATVDVPVAGTAQPGASVTVSLGGGLTATATAGTDGSWSTVVPNVPVGDRTISVTENIGGTDTAPVTQDLSVRVAAPVALTTPRDGSSIPVALGTSTVSVPASGTAQPGARVSVSLDGGTAVVVTAGPDGSWSTTFAGVAVGTHEVAAAETLADGTTTPVTNAFTVAVAPALVVTTPQAGQSFQIPAGGTATVPVSGTGLPGAGVSVTLDGGTPATATVGSDGTWTVSFPGVAAGDHSVVATQTVRGTDQAPVEVSFSVDVTTAPAAPVVITAPTAGTVVPDADGNGLVDLPVSGTGEPGSTITVGGGGVTATTTVAPGGAWSTTLTDVPVGAITVVVTQTTGGTLTGSDSVQLEARTIVPATITTPAAGTTLVVSGPTATVDVTVRGAGEPGAAIAVDLGDGLTATATVAGDGSWTAVVRDVPVGDRTISVVETASGAALPAVTRDITVAVGDPVAIVSPRDGAVITVPAEGSTATLPVSGTAAAGATVSVSLDGGTPVTVTAGQDGAWTVTFRNVPTGDHTLAAIETLADGPTTPVTAGVTVRAAAALAVTTPRSGQQYQVATGQTATVAVTGTGEPGASVSVNLDGAGATTATVTANGTWSVTFAGVAPGSHSAAAAQTVLGTTQAPVRVDFTVAVTADPVTPPTITSPSAGQIIRDADGNGTVDFPVTGTGEPGSTIRVDLGSGITRTVTVGSDGTWATTVTDVPNGTRTVVVTQTTGGTTTGSASVTISALRTAPVVITAPTAGQVVPASSLGASVTVTGTAEPGALVRLTLDNGAAVTTTADGSGAWSVPLRGLGQGSHTVAATETVAGATSAPVSVTFTVASVPAGGAITVTSPAPNALIVDAGGDSREDVTVTGTGTPGAPVTVNLDDGTLQTTTVSASGTWSVVFPGVRTGGHSFVASQVVAGVTTAAPAQAFTIQAIAPVTIGSPASGSTFSTLGTGRVTIPVSGRAEPGATVTVTLDGSRVTTVVAGSDGTWSTAFPGVVPGSHGFVVTETVEGFTSAPVTTTFQVIRGVAVGTGNGGAGTGGSGNGGAGGTGGTGTGSGVTSPAGSGSATPTIGQALAYTGSTVLPWMVVGAGILALGLGMLGASRALGRFRSRRR
ncbi:hypothetical protein AS850_10665 [Frondihabitans sp. 762G35]|uniref:beta strand repeat-containing protein n=1 Tax=Frondihabitans sp. 762G35 TaxID=1446794 RepID=UPI000D217596|nr:choice-of-anchor G family protein [Frondihabitans sp. 762G35]ARC57537.1 hypothetical protein AS850_10665 [Frondihabitans sp. 762G35]